MCINDHTYVFNSHAWVVTKLTELLIILKKFVPPLGYIDIEESGGVLESDRIFIVSRAQ